MKTDSKKRSTKSLVLNIISYVVAGILLSVTAFGIIARLTSGGNLYIFGTRFDVVLTDSMSSKNPENTYLDGIDNQIQPLDLAISKKVNSEKDLNLYDIVLFNNPGIGTDMHRIINKTLIGSTKFVIKEASFSTIGTVEGISLSNYTSGIVTNVIYPKEITLVTFSKELTRENTLDICIRNEVLVPELEYEEKDGGLYTKYKITRDYTTPGNLLINHVKSYDYTKQLVLSCNVTLYGDNLEEMNIEKQNLVIEGEDYVAQFNQTYEYEIRGDKSNTSDGTHFTKEDIMAKVVKAIPKLGYLIRYLTSMWGIIMFASIGVIIIAFDIGMIILRKKEEKAKLAAEAANDEQIAENPEEQKGEKGEESEKES